MSSAFVAIPNGSNHSNGSNNNSNPNDPKSKYAATSPLEGDGYHCLGTLGRGSFSTIFCAQKPSGRKVALKFIYLRDHKGEEEDDREERLASYHREINTIARLQNDIGGKNRDLSICNFEDWFLTSQFGCIIMTYMSGGTLAMDIARRHQKGEPYSERRIAYFALQMCEALAFMHENGVAHHDVKSSNILMDQGDKLVLTDFGNAVSLQEEYQEPSGFTELYAAPELLQAHANDSFHGGMDATKIDAFGLGAILFELVSCLAMVEQAGDETIGDFIQREGVDVALNLPCVQLPWLPARGAASTTSNQETSKENNKEGTDQGKRSKDKKESDTVGYSDALRHLIKNLLDPDPTQRWRPAALQNPLRNEPQSPLMASRLMAALTPKPGAQVCIDNVQLGMFVQQGQDWDGFSLDGGQGTIGVVVGLSADAGYCYVQWPKKTLVAHTPKLAYGDPMCCRIGANSKFELQVGPTPIPDFYTCDNTQQKRTAIVYVPNVFDYWIGKMINPHCMVVGVHGNNMILVAPTTQSINIPTIPHAPRQVEECITPMAAQEPQSNSATPEDWHLESGMFRELVGGTSGAVIRGKEQIYEMFYNGMDIQDYEVVSIKRVQSEPLWNAYVASKESIAAEHWGMPNEHLLFLGTHRVSPEQLLQDPHSQTDFFQHVSNGDTDFAGRRISFHSSVVGADFLRHCLAYSPGEFQIVLAKVALGRVMVDSKSSKCDYHSVLEPGPRLGWRSAGSGDDNNLLSIHNMAQAYPAYIITYKQISEGNNRRIIRAARPGTSPRRTAAAGGVSSPRNAAGGDQRRGTTRTPFESTRLVDRNAFAELHTITAMTEYQNESLEELRYYDYLQGVRHATTPTTARTSSPSCSAAAPPAPPPTPPRDPPGTNRSTAATQRQPRTTATTASPVTPKTTNLSNAATTTPNAAANNNETPDSKPSATKQCVVCLDRPVCKVLVPCGHPCLCQVCSTAQGLRKLKNKCPECRKPIQTAVTFYGRVVND